MTKTPKSWQKKHTELHRFGFNGKENDNEVKGTGNQQDYGARIYDPRIGRFLSIDPLTKNFPFYTPYQFAGNKPIMAIDLDGEEDKPAFNQNQSVSPALQSSQAKDLHTYNITVFSKVHTLKGFNDADGTLESDVTFYYVKVQRDNVTKVFAMNYGPLTTCNDGYGQGCKSGTCPAPTFGTTVKKGKVTQLDDKYKQEGLAIGITVNPFYVPYMVTSSTLTNAGYSRLGNRGLVLGLNKDGKFTAVRVGIWESGGPHGKNEVSTAAAIPFKYAGGNVNNVNPNDATSRDNRNFMFMEELDSGTRANPASTSGDDADVSQELGLKAFMTLSADLNGLPMPSDVIYYKTKKESDVVKNQNPPKTAKKKKGV